MLLDKSLTRATKSREILWISSYQILTPSIKCLKWPSNHLTSKTEICTTHTLWSALFFLPPVNLSNHEILFTVPFSADTIFSTVWVVVFARLEFADSPSLTSVSSIPDSLWGWENPAEEFNLPVRNVVIEAEEPWRPWKSEGFRPRLGSAERDLLLLLRVSNYVSTAFPLFSCVSYLRSSSLRRHYVLISRKGQSRGRGAICLSRIPCRKSCSRTRLKCGN